MWPLAFVAHRLRQEWTGEDWVWDLTWSNSVEEGRRRLLFLEGAGGRRWKGKRSLTCGAGASARQRERGNAGARVGLGQRRVGLGPRRGAREGRVAHAEGREPAGAMLLGYEVGTSRLKGRDGGLEGGE
jgi:hypothetical protein